MNREKTKTLILAMLVIMSIIFTQKIWFYSPINLLQSKDSFKQKQLTEIIEIRNQIVAPQRAVISFGNSYYTVVYSDIDKVWRKTKGILDHYFSRESEVQPTTHEKYKEISRLKSIELEFGENIPSALIASVFDTMDNKIVSNIKEINKILIPTLNRGVIYIVGEEENIYEVRLEGYQEDKQLLTFVDQIQGSHYIKYYPLFIDVENYTVMPLSYQELTPQVFVKSEIDVNNEQAVMETAKTFFDENLDFVKTIRETSGAIVFMYGYGEKGVRINNRGRLEYSEDIGSIASTNVVAALDAAIDFVLKHGGFPEGTYLKEIRAQNKGYYFGFGYRIEGLPIVLNTSNMTHPIEIEVYGNKVKSYRTLIRAKMEFPNAFINNSMLLPQKIIEDNISLLKSDYLLDTKEKEIKEEEVLSYIERNITRAEIVYYDTLKDTEKHLILPAWKIKINKRIYYFNGYDGKLLNSSLVN
ncbi:two-component system activity regulator YycH [Natronincola ferrireducens]|uniref:YycH protein n=1 Tax=Natronincola ferrireducens TaxID=393762 RepID=A0A1G9HM52_9FIRM|nr:two-component system activity regulator YycH [Natronincola ferrireducens]SDL13962.1 YycH protein [Natronincola ferrireducens]